MDLFTLTAPVPPAPAAVADELFVDSFAGGGGASLGIEWATGRSPDLAINHDAEAIALHAANHPDSRHYCEDVWQVDPVEACGGRPVGLMWLSPDCKHFSKAKGGKPVSKRVRGLAWVAVRWARAVRPRVIILENVEEFQTWGPLDRETGRPCPARKGQTFRLFVARLRRLGYAVEWQELRACDYGAPTIRKRLFLIARCDGQPIVWPTPTHGKGTSQPWRTAAECIDWSIPCPSIFLTRAEGAAIGVRRPLAEATLRRIARGVQRYVLDSPRPFIVGLGGRMGQSQERPVDRPYQTITAKADAAIIAPVLVPPPTFAEWYADTKDLGGTREEYERLYGGRADGPRGRRGAPPSASPVAPLLVPRYGEREGQAPRAMPIDRPMPTIVPTQNGAQLVAAFMAQHNTDVVGHPMTDPVSTIVGKGCTQALVASHLVKFYGSSTGQASSEPLGTVTAGGEKFAEVRAFLVAYYGTESDGQSLLDPVRTVTSRDRLGLVTVAGETYAIADIGMRMLAPRELFRAQGFPDSYRIDIPFRGKSLSKTAQVRMCGNSVCPDVAAALVRANYVTAAMPATAPAAQPEAA